MRQDRYSKKNKTRLYRHKKGARSWGYYTKILSSKSRTESSKWRGISNGIK